MIILFSVYKTLGFGPKELSREKNETTSFGFAKVGLDHLSSLINGTSNLEALPAVQPA